MAAILPSPLLLEPKRWAVSQQSRRQAPVIALSVRPLVQLPSLGHQTPESNHRNRSLQDENPLCRFGAQGVVRRGPLATRLQAAKQSFSSFEEMIAQADTVLVDFYATWCGPCQLMASLLPEVSARLKGRLKVVKIDTDKYPRVASKFGVQALPTLILFRHGKPIHRLEGALSADALINNIESALSKAA